MRALLILCLSLVSFGLSAQKYQPVNQTVDLVTTPKLAQRNFDVYPPTPVGNNAFIADLNAGRLTAKTASLGAIVGKYSYGFSDSRFDYLNRPTVFAPAPVLVDAPRIAPRLVGNYFSMAPQQAQNVALHKRIPTFATHPSKIIGYPGGLFNDNNDNQLIGRGWTHVSESAKWSDVDNYPTQFRRVIEESYYIAAWQAAQNLPDGDTKNQLLAWAGPRQSNGTFDGPHALITSDAAAREYAKSWVNILESSGWKGGGVDYFSVNHEVHTGSYQQFYAHDGMLTRAIIDEFANRGKTVKSGLSDFANLASVVPFLHDQPALTDMSGNALSGADASIPRYMHYSTIDEPFRGSSQSAPLGESSILATLVKQGKAYVGVGSYQQHTWDEQSFFEKGSDGKYTRDGAGRLIWRSGDRQATVSGQAVTLYSGDTEQQMLKYYGYFARYCANQFFRAGGQHLPLSTARQSGWEQTRFIRQFRLDAESESGLNRPDVAALNERALNPDLVEADAIGMYLFNDYLRGWMRSQQPSNMGQKRLYDESTSRASVEMMEKGFYRASQLNWIFDTPWQLVQPKFWLWKQGVNGTADENERFWKKPIMLGGIATKDGKPTLWLFGQWPCQDVDRYTDVKIWVNKGSGNVSPAYRIRLKGRKAFLDYWTLPDACAGLQPKDIYFQFSSLIGEKITWRGDYREARITTHPTPPAVLESDLTATAAVVANPCSYVVSATGSAVSCGGNATLTATASGVGAAGLTYNWSGNGINLSGQSVSFSAPTGNNTYTYSVSVSKAGCSPQTAQASVIVSGCTTDPGSGTATDSQFSFRVPDNTNAAWHGYSDQQIGFIKAGQDGYTTSVIIGDYDQFENQFLVVQIRNGMGGFVQVTDKKTGRKLNNGPDLGRGNGPSSYSEGDYTNNVNFRNPDGSQKFFYNGKNPAPGPWFTGRNPLLNGDFKGHPSTSLSHGFIEENGIVFSYNKRQLNSWSHANDYKEQMFVEQWVGLDGKKVITHTRMTHNHADLTDYGPYLQEWRLSMINGNRFKAVFYNGNQPYTFATPTRHNGLDNGGAINNRDFPVSEPFIGVEIDDQDPNRIFAHYAPDMWDPSFEHMDSQEGSDCDGCREGMYTSGHVLANLDAKGVWLFHDTWIIGDLNADVRPFIYAQPRPSAPVWNFNATTGRNGWVGFNGLYDPQYPNSASASGWNLTLTGKADGGQPNLDNSFIISPRTAFKASTCPTLYFTVKSRNLSQTNWQVKYTYVGQDREYLNGQYPTANAARYPYNPAVRSNAQSVPFTMVNDNQYHTYEIPMNWNQDSHISTVEIWPNGQTPGGGNWDVLSVGCKRP